MLQAKDIHKLAMKEVGDHLAKEGFEFLSVNSELKKRPSVCMSEGKKNFIL